MKSLLIIALFASLTFAQDCNNPLLAQFNLQGLDAPQSGADLPYCAGLQDATTCCSADTVATFQDRIVGLIDNINNYDAGRDLYIQQLNNNYLADLNNVLANITNNLQDALTTVTNANSTLAGILQGYISAATNASVGAQNISTNFTTALQLYQASRITCFNVAAQVQTSAWCLACNPNYATNGVNDDGSVIFSDTLCQAISNACQPFFDQGAAFNPLISARQAYWNLLAVNTYLQNVQNTGQVGDFVSSPDPYNPLDSQQPVVPPTPWVGGANATDFGQCQYLWGGNAQLNNLLAIGVPSSEINNEEGVLIVEEEAVIVPIANEEDTVIVVDSETGNVNISPGSRLLQDIFAGNDGTWSPDLTAVGLSWDVRADPGDIPIA